MYDKIVVISGGNVMKKKIWIFFCTVIAAASAVLGGCQNKKKNETKRPGADIDVVVEFKGHKISFADTFLTLEEKYGTAYGITRDFSDPEVDEFFVNKTYHPTDVMISDTASEGVSLDFVNDNIFRIALESEKASTNQLKFDMSVKEAADALHIDESSIFYDPEEVSTLNLLFFDQDNNIIEHLNESDSRVLSFSGNAYEYFCLFYRGTSEDYKDVIDSSSYALALTIRDDRLYGLSIYNLEEFTANYDIYDDIYDYYSDWE